MTTTQLRPSARRLPALLGIVFLLAGCAFDLSRVKHTPAQFTTAAPSMPTFVIDETVRFPLGTGYSRTLNAGTRWKHVGTVREGDVYRTSDQIFTVEASNIFEACLVVTNRNLIGFYLPVENAFSPLKKPLSLPITVGADR